MDLKERTPYLVDALIDSKTWKICCDFMKLSTCGYYWEFKELFEQAAASYRDGDPNHNRDISVLLEDSNISIAFELWKSGFIERLYRGPAGGLYATGIDLDRIVKFIETSAVLGAVVKGWSVTYQAAAICVLHANLGGSERAKTVLNVVHQAVSEFYPSDVNSSVASLFASGWFGVASPESRLIVLRADIKDTITKTIASFYETPKESET